MNLENEVWEEIDEHPDYLVSNYGRVRSLDRYTIGKLGSKRLHKGGILKHWLTKDGYPQVELNRKTYRVHRLVAMAFIPNPDGKKEVNHKDRVRNNNHVDNLEWTTLQENQEHSWNNGRVGCMKGRFGFDHNLSHPIAMLIDNKIIEVFGSIKEAARKLNASDASIGQAIKRGGEFSKKSHKLYGFRFEKIFNHGTV